MAAAIVQQDTVAPGNSNSSTIVSNALSVTANNLLVCFFRGSDTSRPITSVSDTVGNTWTQVVSNVAGDPAISCWYTINSTTHASNVITGTYSGGVNYRIIHTVEVSGIDTVSPLDTFDDQNGSGTTSLTTSAITTSAAGILLAFASQNTFASYTAGTDFTLLNGQMGSGSFYGGSERYITTGALTSYTPGITSDSTNQYSMICAAFKAAAGATGNPWNYYAQQ